MDVFLFIVAGILILIGMVGSILPGIPGPPIGYLGILLLHFTDKVQYGTWFLIIWALVVILVQVLDQFLPIWSTKRMGGSKWGVVGSVVGLIVGMIFPPVGLIVGTFLGAIIGELFFSKDVRKALKSGVGAFLGFIVTTAMKLGIAFVFVYYYIKALIVAL